MEHLEDTDIVSGNQGQPNQSYSKEQRLQRACLRVAMVIRGLWEEKGSSDTRLLEGLLLPDELTVVGRSVALENGEGKVRREHVVPRRAIIMKCHDMLADGQSDEAIAKIIRDNTKIVLVSEAECERLDRVKHMNLKQKMPGGWEFGGDVFARLQVAGIEWTLLSDQHS